MIIIEKTKKLSFTFQTIQKNCPLKLQSSPCLFTFRQLKLIMAHGPADFNLETLLNYLSLPFSWRLQFQPSPQLAGRESYV